MRNCFLIVALAAVGTALAAQPTPGLSIQTVVHEPKASEVGAHIANIQVANPFYDPLQPTGEPQFLTAYGNGKGPGDELDRVSDEFYAIGGTTTHDMAVLTNNTGTDITIDCTAFGGAPDTGGFQLLSSRPKNDPSSAPEQSSPDGAAIHLIYPFDALSVTVPNGSAVAVFVIASKWRQALDTSPREYIWTFEFLDTGATSYQVEADLLVPKVGGSNPTGCASSPDGFPHGLWVVAGGAIAAICTRRKLLKKARVRK
ncbi:MAG: hypothetical protein K8I27_04260 [Planctomycetes bacterium]|nr:hypothetical protein [Planctomycetota bacterium]